ncbi:MAG TPA: tetratricopeptide repeat protein [Streptosporangiaceae bacterium]|nr:tetratricopeptide repeat protein [Streptosporangiaceae bacterium]
MTTPARCTQPGCGGTIDAGYCNVCGVAAAPRAPEVPASTGTPTTGLGARGTQGTAGTGSGSGQSSGSRRSRSGGTRASRPSRSSRGSLGAGLIEVPPVPARDPATAVLTNPQVPENRRYCGVCERPVGRSRDGRPGLAEGYCPNCGSRFSFTPKLVQGELVAGQYEVLGCLAHGGLGWLYLAMDLNLSKRWVVLKGLLNTTDPAAVEAAVAERRFLAEVQHPSIVDVYNFVQHADAATGEQAGYIVMEYVGGQSLRQILLARRRTASESLPLPIALAYLIEVLPALGYLHSRGLVYCDFKPDNVIQTEEQLKLIDMGGVRPIDDEDSAIYGTVGYQAPEIADEGPSPSSDLYTVGRALAVLSFEFTGYQTTYRHTLPDPASVPVLAENESFLRALRRATDAKPDRRFETATEMADQLTGVLREVLAVGDGQQRPAFSTLFGPELRTIGVPAIQSGGMMQPGAAGAAGAVPPAQAPLPPPGTAEIIAGLPVPTVDRADPAAGYLATLGTLEPAQLTAVLSRAVAGAQGVPSAVAESAEALFALSRARIVMGDLTGAMAALEAVPEQADWRIPWYQGLANLAGGRYATARAAFDAVYDLLPGELAPKLALAFAAEASGDQLLATRYFRLVLTVDRSFVSAAFGLARALLHAGDRTGAISALGTVPDSSVHYAAAQVAAVRIRVLPPRGAPCVSAADISEAGRGLGRLTLDPAAAAQVTAQVLSAALDRLRASEPLDGKELLGCATNERSLRFGLERSYRAQAQLTSDRARRMQLVDLANYVRPSTWS